MAFNSTQLILYISNLCHRPLSGCKVSIIPHPMRLTSVYTLISGLGVTTWWHSLSALLIYHFISISPLLEISTFLFKNCYSDI